MAENSGLKPDSPETRKDGISLRITGVNDVGRYNYPFGGVTNISIPISGMESEMLELRVVKVTNHGKERTEIRVIRHGMANLDGGDTVYKVTLAVEDEQPDHEIVFRQTETPDGPVFSTERKPEVKFKGVKIVASDHLAQEADFIVKDGVVTKNRRGPTGWTVAPAGIEDGYYSWIGLQDD